MEVYGTGVMDVKNYEPEIFVAASGVSGQINYSQNDMYLEFFAVSADAEGAMEQEPLTELTLKIQYRGRLMTAGMVVGDIDGDKYNNEMALMMVTDSEIRLFVYRLIFKDGKLTLSAMSNANGIQVLFVDKSYSETCIISI